MRFPPHCRSTRLFPWTPAGFTLVEILVSVTVLILIVIAIASMAGSANVVWLQGERNVEVYQNGRAVLEMMSRELSQAAISNRLQFVQSPGNLNIPANEPQQVSASPLFWQAPLADTPKGNLCEVGYYLTRTPDTSTAKKMYQLKRFFVRPDNTNYGVGTSHWVTDTSPAINTANWVIGLDQKAFSSTDPASVVTTLSEGMLGLWARCLDENGDPVPWMNYAGGNTTPTNLGLIKFNSAGCFQPAIPGQSKSFKWTNTGLDANGNPPSGASSPYVPPTAQAHRLPASVEITIAQVDQRTAASIQKLPMMPQSNDAADMPAKIAEMQQAFDAKHIAGGHIFATRVILPKQ